MQPIKRKRGFASLSPEQRRAVSRKGGSAKVSKGFARLTPEQRSEISRKGALALNEKRKQEKDDKEDSRS